MITDREGAGVQSGLVTLACSFCELLPAWDGVWVRSYGPITILGSEVTSNDE